MNYANRIAALAAGISLAACGGGGLVEDPALTRAAVAQATATLDSAEIAVTKAYEASRTIPVVADLPAGHRGQPSYSFPGSATPPISEGTPKNAKYVKFIQYNSGSAVTASVVLAL